MQTKLQLFPNAGGFRFVSFFRKLTKQKNKYPVISSKSCQNKKMEKENITHKIIGAAYNDIKLLS
ncbi:MAG: hypothetical protein U9Q89_01745 [Thermodesulfobacteriota bacterium]|nr:hypothetical protein [Thermodesulfobacteriota bacterium]